MMLSFGICLLNFFQTQDHESRKAAFQLWQAHVYAHGKCSVREREEEGNHLTHDVGFYFP